MDGLALIILALGTVAYFAYAIPAMREFFAYCELVAIATGRTDENADRKAEDDGGLNSFQREQYRLLRSGEFMNSGNAEVVARGIAVAHKINVLFWGAVALVLSFGAVTSRVW